MVPFGSGVHTKPVFALDTSVIRSASSFSQPGKFTLNDFEKDGLIAIPGDVIHELTTSIDGEDEFSKKRAAALKILNVKPILLPSSSVYFKWLFGVVDDVEVKRHVLMMAENLTFFAGLEKIEDWNRDEGYQDWNEVRVSGYQNWSENHKLYRKERYGGDRKLTISDYESDDKVEELFSEIKYGSVPDDMVVPEAVLERARQLLDHYLQLIKTYQKDVFLNGGSAAKNDRGDSDIISLASRFSPLVGGDMVRLVTNEPKWAELSKTICLPDSPLVIELDDFLEKRL